MADEVRRSGRANKGHHTKNADALDEPLLKPKSKPKGEKKSQSVEKSQPGRSQSVQSEEQEEGEAIIRCVCGEQRDIRGRQMICCDTCEAWQHLRCLSLPEGDYWDNKAYYCEQCRPDQHPELLAAMARGEKPWNRKKGQKPPKPRPSDVKAEPKQEKAKVPTPQKTQTPPSAPPPAQPPAPLPPQAAPEAPAPTPMSKDAQQEAPNGQAETKPSKSQTPKSQPQSPLGEKRRHESSAEKDAASKKRRKSSAQHSDKATPQAGIATDIEALPTKQKKLAEKLRDTLAQEINTASDTRGYRIPDGQTPKSLATRFALQIDHASILKYGEPAGAESPFVLHFRSMMFNLKKNTILIDRLLSGSLLPDEFASMAPEEMASEEKQKEYAAMREANEKQMVLTEETGPRLRKTHKGEEVVGQDDASITDDFRAPPPRDRESMPEEKTADVESPTRDGHAAVELPEDVGRAPLAVDTATAQPDSARRPSTTFDINSVFNQVKSPQNDQQAFLQRRQSSIRVQEQPSQGPGVDADVDRLLKDEEDDVEMSGYAADPTVAWRGTINMQTLASFDVVARWVAGGDFGQIVPWNQLLSSTLPILGRIESAKGDEYIRGMGTSGSHDVGVLALTPISDEGRTEMDKLYQYFQPRNRWGVVPVDKLGSDAMRDLYVIPIEPGGSNLPPFLDMLEDCNIETPRKERMVLLALIAKLPEVKPHVPPAQQSYPVQEIGPGQAPPPIPQMNAQMMGSTNGGPSPSPITNPYGPQYSPMSSNFPPGQQNFGSPYPPQPQQSSNGHQQTPMPPFQYYQVPKAVEIFGPFIEAPVVKQILESQGAIPEEMMVNLRHIVETVPESRDDMNVLSTHMATHMAQKNGQ